MTRPWDITRYEHDPLGGPDTVHFADGHRMPVKPQPPTLTDYDPPPVTPQPPTRPPSVHAPGPNPTRRYPDDPQTRTEPTRGRLRYRPTTLIGGPLNGQTARIYPDDPTPPTITICMAIAWPHWEPTHWLDYHRHPDGTYHWTQT